MERVCAIYNSHSTSAKELIRMREELIKYCKKELKIEKFVLFEDIGSVLKEREDFNDMIDRIHKKEFTDLLVYHPDRIYKATYDKEKFDKIIIDIASYNVDLHSIMNR